MSALTTRVTRSSAVEVLSQQYVRVARAKGLSDRVVLCKHVLKNSLIPTVTVLGLQFERVLEGVVVVETVFGRPGIGRLLVSSVFARDFAVVQGCVLLFAGIFVTVNLLVDVAYAWLDPRIHYVSPLVVMAMFGLGHMVLAASALSFLGLGVQPPTPEWGAMLNRGRDFLLVAPHVMTWPGLAIAVTVLAVNLVGDALRDAMDVHQPARG